MNHSPKFEKIKKYYDKGLWSISAVYDAVNAVDEEWRITAEEFTEITGYPYEI